MTKTAAPAALTFDFSAASTAQIVAFHNELVAEVGSAAGVDAVRRFSDRAVAERRTGRLLAIRNEIVAARAAADAAMAAAAQVAPQTAYVVGTCPKCGDSANGITCGRVIDRKSGQVVVDEHRATCHVCGHEFHYDTGLPLRRASAAKDPAAHAAAIAASWADPAVRAARSARHGVTVDNQAFRSVAQAFEKLGLPMSKHIAFRAELKAAGALEAFGRKWAIVTNITGS